MVYYRQKDNSTRWRTISRLTVRDSNIFSLDCRFKKWDDHTFDHLQTWTVWKQCLQEHRKAPISDTKAPKSRKNHLKIKCATLRELEARSSNLRTSTKKQKRVLVALFCFLSVWMMRTPLCTAEWGSHIEPKDRQASLSGAGEDIFA